MFEDVYAALQFLKIMISMASEIVMTANAERPFLQAVWAALGNAYDID